jgi:hypothetical protein
MMTLAKPFGRWSRATWWLALVGLVACAGTGGDPNLVGCLVDTETEIGDAQALPPGFSISPAEARAGAIGFATGDLERHDGTRIDLTLAIEAAGAMTLQRRSWQTPPGNGRLEPASALDCEDAYALPVTVHAQALPDLDLVASTTLTVTASGRHRSTCASTRPPTSAPPPRSGTTSTTTSPRSTCCSTPGATAERGRARWGSASSGGMARSATRTARCRTPSALGGHG